VHGTPSQWIALAMVLAVTVVAVWMLIRAHRRNSGR